MINKLKTNLLINKKNSEEILKNKTQNHNLIIQTKSMIKKGYLLSKSVIS